MVRVRKGLVQQAAQARGQSSLYSIHLPEAALTVGIHGSASWGCLQAGWPAVKILHGACALVGRGSGAICGVGDTKMRVAAGGKIRLGVGRGALLARRGGRYDGM